MILSLLGIANQKFSYNGIAVRNSYELFWKFSAVTVTIMIALIGVSIAGAQSSIKEAEFKTPNWENNTVLNFGIYNVALERIGSAAYKIEVTPDMGLNNYTIRYNAKSADMSEASTCVIDRKTLLPSRSARKLVLRGSTWYQNAFYSASGVTVTTKRDDGAIVELKLPVGASDRLYDFEEIALIIPQIVWKDNNKAYFYLFRASARATSWVVVEDRGNSTVNWKDKIWKCRKIYIKSDFGEQYMYTTIVNGRTTIAKYDMGSFVFINLDIPSTGTIADLEGEVSLETAFEMAR